MKNKAGVILLTIVVSVLCVYYLSFSFVSRAIQKDAETFATVDGIVDQGLKQQYLDSIWKEDVYNLLGLSFTYEEIKTTELNQGLDLQGGMHVTLEVSPVEIIKGISGNSRNAAFLEAIDEAKKRVKGTQLNFVDEFYNAYQEIAPGEKLSYIFANAANRGRISRESTDQEILDILNDEVDGAVDRSFQILRTRLDRFGTSQPNIQKLQGSGRIQIELPGVDNPSRVRKLLQGVAKLEFWEVHQPNDFIGVLQSMNDIIVAEQKAKAEETGLTTDVPQEEEDITDLLTSDTSDSTNVADSLLAESDTTSNALDSAINTQLSPIFELLDRSYFSSFGWMIYPLADTAKINDILQREDIQALIPGDMKFLWNVKKMDFNDEGDDREMIQLYAIKVSRTGKAPLSGEVITNARQDFNQGRPVVSMAMNANGAKDWKKLTGANINRRIAIVLDNFVYSAPNVENEIPNGSSQISGSFTVEEAQDLANILKAGALPAPTTIVEDVVVGPTLGDVARKQGIISIVAGLGIVLVFMIAYYSKGGLVANAALAFNVFFILGILAQLSASLTLPGIAGIVLTIGMSIDANVLIFERIKEELRNGAGLKQAISSGYSKAFSSIVDANLTTLITAIILYALGQGPLKGFAITLMIGIMCSFFSAVFITRVIIEWMSKKGDKSNISFATPFSKNALTKLSFDFITKRRIAYMFSIAFIAVGIVALIIKGLTLGVDFKGGRSFVVEFPEAVVTSKMETALSNSFDKQGTEVKTFGASNRVKVTTSFMIDDDSDEADAQVRAALINGLAAYSGLEYVEDAKQIDEGHFSVLSSSKVGATIADDIKNSSYKSGLFALIAIFLYIFIRFRKWQFGLGALVALAHDTLFVVSAFAIANLFGYSLEVDQVFVAAILTIIGYSINDTVVVFDRIRENLGIKSGSEMVSVFNESLNNTISRTLITSATTLIVVLILFVFGGAALQGFSFAMIVGILIGTYSSVFIATPIVIDFNKKKAVAA